MIDYQFYASSAKLSEKAYSKFKDREITRLLDIFAGTGSLAWGGPKRHHREHDHLHYPVDVIEIDVKHHPALREKGFNIVGHDFDDFGSLSIYSHILMNPPFAKGCQHVLKAWNGLFHGEIVAIVNAETVRNPFSGERKQLLSIIDKFGDVEFIQEAFMGEGVERETPVEIALIHLRKEADNTAFVSNLLGSLRVDSTQTDKVHVHADANSLMLPESYVENACAVFRVAAQACHEACAAQARAIYCKDWLGKSMAVVMSGIKNDKTFNVSDHIRNVFAKEYLELKDRAWTHILHCADLDGKLSVNARKRVHKEFHQIKALEFTEFNIYGFLLGLAESAWDIQREMICETFDLFTRYAEDNTVYYMGWKSNSKHKSCGMRLKTTRFILPGFSNRGWSYVGYDEIRKLEDIDKSFAILDGKHASGPDGKDSGGFGLKALFNTKLKELEAGERLSCDYFDVRYYPGRGTVHFFPKRKDLIERLNRLVGQWRQWLPPSEQDAQVSKEFWRQYDNAEKFSSTIQSKFAKAAATTTGHRWMSLSHAAFSRADSEEGAVAQAILGEAISSTLEENGYRLDTLLAHDAPAQSIEESTVVGDELAAANGNLPLLLAA